MPIYEEKLISPFAIHFSQGKIRSTFRDGRDVEATCGEIERKPGYGGYDLVLKAPFPAIEITRWTPGSRADRRTSERWFTYDNRRLYCLQKAAAAHWPLRVAAVVEVSVYAQHSSSTMRRKLDTVTSGQSVVMARTCRSQEFAPILEWDWRQAARSSASRQQAAAVCAKTTEEMEQASFDKVAADGQKTTVDDLPDSLECPTSLLSMALGDCHIDESFNTQATPLEASSEPQDLFQEDHQGREPTRPRGAARGRCGGNAAGCMKWVPVGAA